MKVKKFILLATALTILIYSAPYILKNTENKIGKNAEKLGTQLNTSDPNKSTSNFTFDIPNKSTSILNVPWENDADFKTAQNKNGTDVLISAFCIVIKNTTEEEQHNVHLATKSVSGMVIQPGEIFSQNNSIGPYTEEKGYKEGSAYIGGVITPSIGGGACKVASTLYNLAVLSNLEIIERHSHSMPVHYLPYGQDSTVAYGFKDIQFKNTTDAPILLWAMPIENRVYMGFYGKEEAPNVKWRHNILEKRVAPIKYQINSALEEGEEKIIIEGMDGAKVESHVIIEYENGTTEKKQLKTSNYWPMPHIIEVRRLPAK